MIDRTQTNVSHTMKTMIALLVFLTGARVASAGTNFVEKAGGPGIFTTITAAIQASGPFDTIKIGPGLYTENVRVPWSLTFLGAGPQYTTLRASTTDAAFQAEPSAATPKMISIYALTITNPIGDGVNSLNYDLRIENCVIANCGRYAVSYSPAAGGSVVIRQCTIASNFSFAFHSPSGFGTASFGVDGTIVFRNNEAGTQQDNVGLGIRIASGCLIVGKPLLHLTMADSFSATDANFMDAPAGNFILKAPSPAINAGRAGFLDPDGSIHDVGAYGGPGAAAFWPYPAGGPVISSLQVTPVVQQGGKVTVKAAATTR